jgi:predicted dehydrogenase
MITRREFLDTAAVGAAGLAIGSTAKSYAQILGANDRVRFAIIGVHNRGEAHLAGLAANKETSRVVYACDVESTFLDNFAAKAEKTLGYSVQKEGDFRKLLDKKDVDAITIATPDHWHTPLAIDGLKAGKDVYVEKPCSHNPAEGALLVEAQKKYGKLVQMGDQSRSAPHMIEVVKRIHDGEIGRTYYGFAWYAAARPSIGIGKPAPVPPSLNWDLWQGPAPRQPYKDNVQPYNWHWFKIWGTGEACNNGIHEVDVCRWALQVGYPERVTAPGGRYQFKDDWQFYDTLAANWLYGDKIMGWQGRSCQGMPIDKRGRGSEIMGTKGTVIVDRDGYDIFDLEGHKTDERRVSEESDESTRDLQGADRMTELHFANFIAGITKGEQLHSPIEEGNISTTLMQLSNIAWEVQHELHLNTADGKILNDSEAMKGWGRTYQKGWEPRI